MAAAHYEQSRSPNNCHPERTHPGSLTQKIFVLQGASAGYFLRNRALQGSTRQLGNLALIVGLNFFLGSSSGSMIDNSGHLGGLVVGLLLSLGMAPSWDIVSAVLPTTLDSSCTWPGLPDVYDGEHMPATLTSFGHDCATSARFAPLIMVRTVANASASLKPRQSWQPRLTMLGGLA